VICKVCQAGKQFSAVTPVICKVCQANKRFSAVIPVICIVCQAKTAENAYLLDKLYK
jgi:acetyl-CoA carboxylase carboxyltransferase component